MYMYVFSITGTLKIHVCKQNFRHFLFQNDSLQEIYILRLIICVSLKERTEGHY